MLAPPRPTAYSMEHAAGTNMQSWQDLFTTSQEGLKLYARRYGPAQSKLLPVVCLAGLSRNSVDFHELAEHLTGSAERQVFAFDYRGRGRSDYDPDWRNYDLRVELTDVLDMMTAFGIAEAIMIGTSRGGILSMAMPMLRPGAVRGVVLNDMGAVIDGKGLARIRSYVGKLPALKNFSEGAAVLKRISGAQFPDMPDEAWETQARRTWKEEGGKLTPQYDIKLLKTLENLDLEQPLPTLWPQFGSLAHAPVLIVRGENSDILAQNTAEEMQKRHPDCDLHVVPGQGHAPLLADAPTLNRIAAFVEKCEIAASKPRAA